MANAAEEEKNGGSMASATEEQKIGGSMVSATEEQKNGGSKASAAEEQKNGDSKAEATAGEEDGQVQITNVKRRLQFDEIDEAQEDEAADEADVHPQAGQEEPCLHWLQMWMVER